MRYTVCIRIEPDGDGFHGYSPSLPGLHVCGATPEETLAYARDAALAYIESMIASGEPLPLDCRPHASPARGEHVTSVEVALA